MPVFIDGYPMDLAVTETHGFNSDATEYPVENGADITDHVRAKPITIELECVVSDTPLAKIANDATRQGSVLPSADAYAHLLAIRDARQPITIETSLGSFASMVLTSLSVPRAIDKTGGLFFTANFQQVRIVENKRVSVRVAIPIAKRSTNYGMRPSTKVEDAVIGWRKGSPPGSFLIVGTEQVHVAALPGGLSSVYYHADGKTTLSPAEINAFRLDMKRDDRLRSIDTNIENAQTKLNNTNDRADRALKLEDARNANPGKYIDPKLFGL